MKRKYFSFPNEAETPEMEDQINYAMAIMAHDAYFCINDDDHGAFETIYACDASIETPEVLNPFMHFSPRTDEVLDRELERRRAAYAKQEAAKAAAEKEEYALFLRLKAKYEQ